jgi:hypothetical protein
LSPNAPYRLGRFMPVAAEDSSSEVPAKPPRQNCAVARANASSGS